MKRSLTVLLADDDATDRLLVKQAVARNGVSVELHTVSDGEEVLEYLHGHGKFSDRRAYPVPELLILDLKMPRMDGLDVLDWLKKHPECGRIPAVIMSGSGLEKDVREAYRRGANTYFSKPNDFAELERLIRLMVDYWARSERQPAPHMCR